MSRFDCKMNSQATILEWTIRSTSHHSNSDSETDQSLWSLRFQDLRLTGCWNITVSYRKGFSTKWISPSRNEKVRET